MLASRGKVAIPIAMSVPDQMPLAEVKNRLSEVVDRLEREHGHVIITKHGRPAAVVISVEDLQSLEETRRYGSGLLNFAAHSPEDSNATEVPILRASNGPNGRGYFSTYRRILARTRLCLSYEG